MVVHIWNISVWNILCLWWVGFIQGFFLNFNLCLKTFGLLSIFKIWPCPCHVNLLKCFIHYLNDLSQIAEKYLQLLCIKSVLHIFPSVTCFSLLHFARLIEKVFLPRLEINSSSRLNVFPQWWIEKRSSPAEERITCNQTAKRRWCEERRGCQWGWVSVPQNHSCLSFHWQNLKKICKITSILWNVMFCTVLTVKV